MAILGWPSTCPLFLINTEYLSFLPTAEKKTFTVKHPRLCEQFRKWTLINPPLWLSMVNWRSTARSKSSWCQPLLTSFSTFRRKLQSVWSRTRNTWLVTVFWPSTRLCMERYDCFRSGFLLYLFSRNLSGSLFPDCRISLITTCSSICFQDVDVPTYVPGVQCWSDAQSGVHDNHARTGSVHCKVCDRDGQQARRQRTCLCLYQHHQATANCYWRWDITLISLCRLVLLQ